MDWLKKLFRRRRRDEWPQHLFVQANGVTIHVGEFSSKERAREAANDEIGRLVMATGEVVLAHYWTSRLEDFTKLEREAFEKKEKT